MRSATFARLLGIGLIGLQAAGCSGAADDEKDMLPGPGYDSVVAEPEERPTSEQVIKFTYEGRGNCSEAGLAAEVPGATGWLACDVDLSDSPEGERIFSRASDLGVQSQRCADHLEVALTLYQTEAGQLLEWESSGEVSIQSALVRGPQGEEAYLYQYSDGEVFAEGLHSAAADIDHVSFCLPIKGELGVGKHLFPDYTALVEWQIDSTVDAEEVELQDGASAIVHHQSLASVAEVKWVDYRVDGEVFVVNNRDTYAELAGVIVVAGAVEGEVDCGVEFPFVLEPGASLHCTSSIDDLDGGTGRAAAIVEVTEDSPLRGGSFENAILWPDPEDASHVNGVINVAGLLHQSFIFGQRCEWWEAPCSTLYSAKFVCPGDAGDYENLVEIVETGQRATSTVEVGCASGFDE